MADVVVFKVGKIPQYLKSVNTPDYGGNPDVVVSPDLSSVINVPQKYWKRDGNNVIEMTASEKQAVDDAELQLRKLSADNYQVGMGEALTALVKVINTRLNANQKITKQEMINAIKEEIT